ncbi:hypothetical protein TRFO_11306 [Tritrichomonas foetus]|uniref:Uncharacterized protein n=1 Tax=Tritrichomonas foetus TaxID=1144522 RepID=A0A1J4J7M7_9EUKA|nr:hypothetical protein TRFO_11306 [Tritrichomonas foetus]|eukprot:OHS94223.1 hypothetical protein TRFO_11306 [Tritrichomonas foetus]
MPNIEYEPNDKGHFSEYYVNTEDISENDRHYESDHNFINSESTDDCFPNYYIFSYSIWKDENENEQNFESEYNDIY